jgi:PAS domain S-box-containing protein
MKVRRILVVDNNTTIVELLGSLLTQAGYEVDRAYDGIGALDRLEEADVLPDTILLDLVMPKIDGQRLTRILKTDERYAHIPIVILSGIAAEEDDRIFAFGADAFIAKGKIDETFKHIQETLKWIEERREPTEKKGEVLGTEKLFPREMTKELLLVKQHYDSMFNLMQEGVIEVDQDHRVLFVNPTAQRLLCMEDHHLFGKPVQDLFADKNAINGYLGGIPRKPDDTYESIQLSCGQYVTRAIASPFFLEGEYIGAIIIIQDITSLIHREKSLEGQMAAIVENAPVGLCLLNEEGLVQVANHSLTRILRQAPDWKPAGLNILEFLSEISPPLSDALRNILTLAPGKILSHKADYLPPSEQLRQVLNVTAKALDVGEGARFLLLVEDVTEKALLEENLRRVNDELDKASKSKSTFLSMVSHELRTPLSVVRGYISLILEGKIGPDPDLMQAALQVADKRARHLQHLIEELLDLSRIEAGKLSIKRENLEIAKHVLETIEMFRDDQDQKDLEIVVDIPEGIPPVFADHDKIHQVFTNLVSNAIKFSSSGGRIVVAARQQGNWAEVKVTDSGVGIPADRIDRIFEKFYQVDSSNTRKHAGTGLGLSIVKMLISALGGSIPVSSELGKGTTFIFTLPLGTAVSPAEEVSTAPEPEPVREEAAARKKRILVVEDDPDTLELVRLFLAEENYAVTVANDAFLGLKEFFRQTPDLVLADALLPLMTGLDLCRVIKNNPETKDLPVVILSAAAQEDEIRSGYEVGANAYLVKPVTSQDLIETIRKHTS